MDPLDENRSGLRMNCMFPVECSGGKHGDPFEATVWNMSDSGVYLETARELGPGENLTLSFPRGLLEDMGISLPGEGTGVVTWTCTMEFDEAVVYGAGVELFFPDRAGKGAGAGEVAYDCDVCGGAVTSGEHLVTLGDIIRMCGSCGRNVINLPNSLHVVASRFLMGNVL
jgi:hypothetical protein